MPIGLTPSRGLVTPVWDDLRFPAQGINPAGAANAPTIDDVLTSFPGTLLFAGNAENVIVGIAQMPHAWAKGTSIRPTSTGANQLDHLQQSRGNSITDILALQATLQKLGLVRLQEQSLLETKQRPIIT